MSNTSLKEKYGLTYQIDYAFLAKSTVGFEGKDVLEVGGSLPSDFVKHDLGARRWTALEEMSYWTETLSTGYVLGVPPDSKKLGCKIADATSLNIINDYNNIYGNIEDIPETLNSSFDAVFSIAAFEHIARLPQALTSMNKALRVGGKLFSLFAPIWSCYNGHHLPEIVDSEGNHWNFGNSPIPAWGHLLMSRTEMLSFLYKKMDAFTAQEIVYFIYNSPHINRYFLDDYLQVIRDADFNCLQVSSMFKFEVPDNIQSILAQRHPGKIDFGNCGILVILEKR